MILTRNLKIPAWDDSAAEVAVEYWRRRGFNELSVETGPRLAGRRGSELGSWFPIRWFRTAYLWELDWRKCETSVVMAPDGPGEVKVELEAFLGPRPRRYTGWGRAFLRLEVAELNHLLCGGESLLDVWTRFEADSRSATAKMAWTKGLMKRPLPEEWDVEIEGLELRFLFPSKPGSAGPDLLGSK